MAFFVDFNVTKLKTQVSISFQFDKSSKRAIYNHGSDFLFFI